jgi:serine/threonine protein kinase
MKETLKDYYASTMLIEGGKKIQASTSANNAAGNHDKPPDPEFEELKLQYRSMLHSRSIPYPVAYKFIKELGHGRQGVVFLSQRYGARGCITNHATKLFDPSIYSTSAKYWTDMGRIAKQISMLQPINNINLISGDFYDECSGIGYIHMQAVDGVDLQFLLDGKHIEMARNRSSDEEWASFIRTLFNLNNGKVSIKAGAAVFILRNVLRGLSGLHEHGFIHGDIKPTNVMIDIQGTVKLVDLGRAVRIGEHVNILLGSPLFMAPEMHRREASYEPSDLFSTGLLALELLKSRQLADMANNNENELLDFKIELARNLEKYIPSDALNNIELIRSLRKFLEPSIPERFQSVREAENGEHGLAEVRQWMTDEERETEYERQFEHYLSKLVDPETGTLNPHFASDNLTAAINILEANL